jgi:hypothetical protein
MSNVIDMNTPGGCGRHSRCEGKTASGERCKRQALPGGRFCHHHEPSRADAVKEAARKGGSVPRRPKLPEADALDAEGARRVLAAVLAGLLAGGITEGVARSVGYLLATDAKLREVGELAERIEILEGLNHGRTTATA